MCLCTYIHGVQIFLKYRSELHTWTIPFILSYGDVRIVQRSIALRNQEYGYTEGKSVPGGFLVAFLVKKQKKKKKKNIKVNFIKANKSKIVGSTTTGQKSP